MKPLPQSARGRLHRDASAGAACTAHRARTLGAPASAVTGVLAAAFSVLQAADLAI